MAADAERGQEYAERPKEGELWQEMIRRQEKEGGNRGGSSRELLRSLPAEQQEDKGRGGRGDIAPGLSPLMAEEFPQSYQELLREASQRAVPQQERELER